MVKRAQYLPVELRSRFENLNTSAIDSLEESVKMQQALETRLWEQMSTGESSQAWQVLNELVPQYEYSDPDTREAIFSRIKQIAEGGLKAYGVKKEIQNIHESQRKLTETLTKCRKEAQQTYTQEMWNEMLSSLLRILKQNVPTDVLRTVAVEIQRLGQENNGVNHQRTIEVKAVRGAGKAGGAGDAEGQG